MNLFQTMLGATAMAGALSMALSPAGAQPGKAPPILSGTYAFSQRTFCQPTLLVTYNKKNVASVSLNGSGTFGGVGDVQLTVGVVNFDTGFQELKYSGTMEEGSPVLLHSQSGGADQGNPVTESVASNRLSYSNTDTTVTLGGQVYQAAYGHVAKGFAQHVVLIALDSNGCSQQWELDRQ